MIAKDREILETFGPCPQERNGCRGGGCLKANGKEDDLAVGILAGKLESIEWRVDEAHISSIGLGVKEAALRAWYAHHITKGGEDHSIGTGDGNGVIDSAHRQDAHRTTRPM